MIYLDTSIYKQQLSELDGQTFEMFYFEIVKEKINEKNQECIVDFCQQLNFPFPANIETVEERFKWLILCPPKNIKNAIQHLEESKLVSLREEIKSKKESEITKAFISLKDYFKVLGKEESFNRQKLRINNILVRLLGVTVCPYCNRDFINPRGKNLGNDMEHFYDKDHYPLFAMSLYNFVPSCTVCNRIKNNSKAFTVHPFVQEDFTPENELRFEYKLKRIDEMEVELKGEPERISELENIKLVEAYAIHSIDIQNMLYREERYSQSYRNELRQIFKVDGSGHSEFQLSLTDDEIDRMIYGNTVFEEDIRNIPLGKFRRDIYQEIKKLRKD